MVSVFLSIMAGAFAVLQAGTNKIISQTWGFSSALLLNGIVFLVFNFLIAFHADALALARGHAVDPVILDGLRGDFRDGHVAEEWQQMDPQAVAVTFDVFGIALAGGQGGVLRLELGGGVLEQMTAL